MSILFSDTKYRCLQCKACNLCATRTNIVFGVGNEEANILFVGEAPGETEDQKGEPFVGRSGRLLDCYLNSIGLDRNKNIYIANMVKCRPPQNRNPKPQETEACLPWLQEQLNLLKPSIVVCLGRIAACRLISSSFKVTKQHGEFIQIGNILFMGTYHPAMLLRDPRKKDDAQQDFLHLRDKIDELGLLDASGLPIKQGLDLDNHSFELS